MKKLKLKLDDPETRAVWAAAQRAKAEVASWPAWKRGESGGSNETTKGAVMTLNEYQRLAGLTSKRTALYVYDESTDTYTKVPGLYNGLGLNGEAGEVAEKLKKLARDGGTPEEIADALNKELGDTLWYLSQVADDYGFTLQEIAEANLEKIRDRAARGVLSGSGDDR
jgi:NTP pyrophosphatase (non-canonical NTP hydrolase)